MAFDYQEHLSHWALGKHLESLSVFKVTLWPWLFSLAELVLTIKLKM